MNIKSRALDYRHDFQAAFDACLRFASEGPFQKELLKAKEHFFGRLGRSHETAEDLYESSSQSFLEWYLFNYVTRAFHKTPAVIFVTLGLDAEKHLRMIEAALLQRWSLFEVKSVQSNAIVLKDLLFQKERKLYYEPQMTEYRVWRVKVGQIIQARLFPYADFPYYFMTHCWLHPQREEGLLKEVTDQRAKLWSLHTEFLVASFETLVRTYGIESQLSVSRASNWNYQELVKKYAKAS